MKLTRYVLTGGPCAGKSSVLKELGNAGFSVLGETAREVIGSEDYNDPFNRQIEIIRRQVAKEEKVNGLEGIIFLDRSLIDILVYSSFYNIAVFEHLANLDLEERYSKKVFLLDRFPFQKDGLRIEGGEEEAKKIHRLLGHTYKVFDYEVIDVPIMPVNERAKFILESVRTQ